MRIHSIRKFFVLTVLYIVAFAIILLLQFRNESTVMHSIGALRVTVSEIQDENKGKSLKNTLQASFPGISFVANDAKPAELLRADGTSEPLLLSDFSVADDNACTFTFAGGTALHFSVAGSGEESRLEIAAELPEDALSLRLEYAAESGYSLSKNSDKQMIFDSQKGTFAFKSSEVAENAFVISAGDNALFAPYDPTSVFTFESSLAHKKAEKTELENAVKNLRERVVQAFLGAESAQITEDAVMAFVAEMAQNGRYQEALNAVPSSFKRSSRRTFRTTPYFGNLVEMNRTLAMQLNNDKTVVSQALTAGNLGIFANWDIISYLTIMSGTENVHRLLSIPQSIASIGDFEPTLMEAAGILNMYSVFLPLDSSCAKMLESVLGRCLEIFEANLKITDEKIALASPDTALSVLDLVKIGSALMNYGEISGRNDIAATGRFIVMTSLEENTDLELWQLSALYALLVKDNQFYPRAIILDNTTDPTAPLWVWTAANAVSAKNTAQSIELTFTFPQFESHYSLVSGVKSLKAIEIYGMFYRTDPRFESYNSSGYAYSADTRTLLLKTRHKERNEVIRVTLN